MNAGGVNAGRDGGSYPEQFIEHRTASRRLVVACQFPEATSFKIASRGSIFPVDIYFYKIFT
jgi:hypothetical protein